MSENILEVRDLEKSFGGLKVLTGVEFEVKRGEKLALALGTKGLVNIHESQENLQNREKTPAKALDLSNRVW